MVGVAESPEVISEETLVAEAAFRDAVVIVAEAIFAAAMIPVVEVVEVYAVGIKGHESTSKYLYSIHVPNEARRNSAHCSRQG